MSSRFFRHRVSSTASSLSTRASMSSRTSLGMRVATTSTSRDPILVRLRKRCDSLSVRYVGLMLAIVVITGLLLGAAVTIASVRNAAHERVASIEYASKVAAAALMPVIADQDATRVESQLQSIMSLTAGLDIQCIEIEDAAGNVLAESIQDCTCDTVEPSTGLLDVFTEPQVSRVPVEADGLRLATVSIQFRPVGLDRAVRQPTVTMALVLSSAMVVAGLWAGWLVMRSVVEPIDALRDAAETIAGGGRDVRLEYDRDDEIGGLARSLQAMTEQLQEQERRLVASYNSLETAFHDKADLAE
ncbi:HAMP domain-containing protein, partial [bacterium]|nr:HAMP domain-containing protein [bacterium]